MEGRRFPPHSPKNIQMNGPRRMKGRKSTSQFVMARHVLPRKWSCFPQALLSSISIEQQFPTIPVSLGCASSNYKSFACLWPLPRVATCQVIFECWHISMFSYYWKRTLFFVKGGPKFYFKLKVDQNFNSLS